jgi:hypothetical protein
MTNQLYNLATGNIDQAADHNQVIDMLNILLGYTNTTILNGATTGTATLYELLQGPVKIVLVSMATFRNNGASGQTITLPAAFTKGALGWNSGCGTFQLLSAGSAITVQIHTGFESTSADGTVSGGVNVKQNNQWHADVAFDTIYFNGSDASTHNGYILIIGS